MVKSPQNLGESDIDKLKELVQQFPYFAIAQNLLVKSLHNTKHYEYDKQLKIAALQAGNRSVLYNLVHNLPLETETQDWPGQSIEHLTLAEPQVIAKPTPINEEAKPVETIETPIFAEPTPIIEVPKPVETTEPKVIVEPTPIIEAPKPAETIEPPVIVEPTPIIELPKPVKEQEPERNPDIVYEEEKLIEPTGKYEKFVPKPRKKNTSEESLITEPDDELFNILPDFDISSLNGIITPPAPATPEPIEEDSTAPFEEKIIEPTKEEIAPTQPVISEVEPAFFDWLKQKETAAEPTIELPTEIAEPETTQTPVAIEIPEIKQEEDSVFVENFQHKIAEQSHIHLVQEVKNSEQYLYEVPDVPEPIVTQITENPVDLTPISEPIIKVEEPKEILEIRAEPKHEAIPETKVFSPLESLENYEVNEFLAPLYLQVKYNDSLFELNFEEVFEKNNPPQNITWEEPFVFLNPEPQESIIPPIPEPIIDIKPVDSLPIFEDLSYESTVWVESQKRNNVQEEQPEIVIPKKESAPLVENKIEKPEVEVKPKIADLPPPKIARDPGTVESILDKFIRENPSIARPKSEFYSPVNMAKQSAEESEEIVSETLANIYTKQGLYKKAVQMYEKLGLHYPEKFTYFAGLIEQIKSAHNIE